MAADQPTSHCRIAFAVHAGQWNNLLCETHSPVLHCGILRDYCGNTSCSASTVFELVRWQRKCLARLASD